MRRLPLADHLRIASPCEQDEGTSFCPSCQQVVHDVSSMTRDEVAALVRSRRKDERLCVRLLRRTSDDAILLADGFALPSHRLAPKRLTAAVVTLSAAALAGCAPELSKARDPSAQVASRAPMPPPLPDPPMTAHELWLEEAAGMAPGEFRTQAQIRALASKNVSAEVGRIEGVTRIIPPWWPSWP